MQKKTAKLFFGIFERVDDEGGGPRAGVARVPFWAGTHANPSQTAAPASPRQRTRDFLYNEARERSEHFFPWFSKEKKASS